MNEWWGGQPDELKQAFSLFPDRRWEGADLHLLNNIRNYCHLKKEGLLFEDDRSMLSEIVSELADAELCRANGRTLEDMCDTDGAFLEEYQEQFNRIYDELEMRITDYMNGQSKICKMKAKVFRYKSDGNTVVAPYMELEPYAENVYLSLSEKNEYGNEDEDCFHVVCKIENVCFSCGQYSRRFLNGENRREEAAAYCRNWIADTLQSAEKDLLSSCSPSACSRPSDSTPHPCCKPVKHTKGSRNRNAGNRNRKRRKSAGYVKSNISCCSMSINRNSWKGNGLRARCSLRLPNGTALKYISGPKACWAAA